MAHSNKKTKSAVLSHVAVFTYESVCVYISSCTPGYEGITSHSNLKTPVDRWLRRDIMVWNYGFCDVVLYCMVVSDVMVGIMRLANPEKKKCIMNRPLERDCYISTYKCIRISKQDFSFRYNMEVSGRKWNLILVCLVFYSVKYFSGVRNPLHPTWISQRAIWCWWVMPTLRYFFYLLLLILLLLFYYYYYRQL